MAGTVTVVALQPELEWRKTMQNLARLRGKVDRVCAEGDVDLLVLPEHLNATSSTEGPPQDADQVRQFVCTTARANRVNVVGGSAECHDEEGRLRNVCFVSDRDGRLRGWYFKQRPFAGEQNRGVVPGSRHEVFELDCAKVGILICADLWYPELVRQVAPQTDLLCVPAETAVRDKDLTDYARRLWWALAMTRAHENAVPVIVADVAQVHYPTHWASGASSINDPSRKPDLSAIQVTFPGGRTGALRAKIDLAACAEFREYRRQAGLLPPGV